MIVNVCLLPTGHDDQLVYLDAQLGGQGSLGMYEGFKKDIENT